MVSIYALSAPRPELKGLIRDIRVVWTLRELGEPYERKVMNPKKGEHKTPEYLSLNPFGKVPTMKDGDLVLFESSAICTYLADKKERLIPRSGTRERAIYNQWVAFTISTFEPWASRTLAFDLTPEKNPTTEKLRDQAAETADSFLRVVDGVLARQPYLVGETFSVADILFSSGCRSIEHTELTHRHARLRSYLDQNFARQAFKEALSENGEPAV